MPCGIRLLALLRAKMTIMPAVVFGAAVLEDGSPSPTLRRRTLAAVTLMQQGLANKIIASGGVGRHPPAEAMVIREIALRQGIDEHDVIMDVHSSSTIETALNCSAIVRKLGHRRVWVVTDGYHMHRCLLAFRALGVHGEPVHVDHHLFASTRLNMLKARFREVFACVASAPRIIYIYSMRRCKGV